MTVTSPVVTFDQLYVGMEVVVIDPCRKRRRRATIIRLHTVRTKQFSVGKFPTNSRRGGCDFATYDGSVYASLRTYSEDGEPLEDLCDAGNCIHVRYRNNVKVRAELCYIRPIDALKLLAEQSE